MRDRERDEEERVGKYGADRQTDRSIGKYSCGGENGSVVMLRSKKFQGKQHATKYYFRTQFHDSS